jgi:hypothetical protein
MVTATTAPPLRRAALSILREGRLTLLGVETDRDDGYRPLRILGRVVGHNGTYAVDWFAPSDGWTCTCRPWISGDRRPCAHILATQLVTTDSEDGQR